MSADPKAPFERISPGSPGPHLTPSESMPATVLETPPSPSPEQHVQYTGFALWLHRTTVLMFVFVCASIGVLLVILPWRPEWTDNHLLLGNPSLRAFVANGFVRGVVTGLGLLDIWIGFWEAIHYREESRP